MTLLSHLSILSQSSKRYPNLPAFKVPTAGSTPDSLEWEPISYKQFYDDVELFGRYWAHTLRGANVPERSVVGLWIGGFTYIDVLHIYGVSRAGYIPQLFSLRLPNPTVIFELLEKAKASALICDFTTFGIAKDSPLPVFCTPHVSDIDSIVSGVDAPVISAVEGHEIAFYFHTSGSTSGSPKLVPCNYHWLDAVARKASQLCVPKNPERQDVTTWMGSMCHIGQTTLLICIMQYGTCITQPSKLPFSSEELKAMVHQCGLNRLYQFAAFLSMNLRISRKDPELLSALLSMDEVVYAGMALPQEDEDYAYNCGIKLRNIFGSTELGGSAMLSIGGSDPRTRHHLRPLKGLSYSFVPIQDSTNDAHQSTARLLEFVVLADSGDCPDESLRQADGNFHTGDLFQEVGPGSYIFAGRDDDWIKSETSLRCDTKSIEDNARAMCGSLISECIAVGSGRPSPVLFVESSMEMDEQKLKREIYRKIRHFHSRRYVHESITSAKMIVVVPRGSLPRTATKGNIRRKAVEETYKAQLDELYGTQKL